MRIGVDVRLLTTGRSTGVEEYARSILSALFARADEHRYVLWYNGVRRAPLPESWCYHPKVNIVTSAIPNKLVDMSLRVFREPNFRRFTREPIDLLYSPHLNIAVAPPSVPSVMTIHDLSFVHYPEFVLPRRRAWHWLQSYAARARAAAAVVTDAAFTARDVVRTLGVDTQRVSVVYPGLSDYFAAEPCPGEDVRAPLLLSVGTFEPRKNHDALLAAFRILKSRPGFREAKLCFVGAPGWKYGRIRRVAAAQGVASDVEWRTSVSQEELKAMYRRARVFAYPSWFEGFGFPLLEAMACGTPVVTSDRASIPEVVGDAALMVDPWNADALAEAIERVWHDGSDRTEYIARGCRRAREFRWDRAAEHLIRVFERVTSFSPHADYRTAS